MIRVPASLSVTQLKDRESKKAVTPFNFDKEKDKAVDRYRYHTPQFVELDMRHFAQPH